MAIAGYQMTRVPQVVSYTAPTGAGKTIVMAALIESIYYGDELHPEQNDAIFVWLSDSPQLNEQSKLKIETKAEKCFGRCVTVTDEAFDQEVLEDGHIYFLNTQKLGKNSNLTRRSDVRQYTIWETLANTVRQKSNRLYFIIDEAHRGAQKANELKKATTIMQKFLLGSEDDRLPPMPVVIGMTATVERFNNLAKNVQKITQSTIQSVVTTPDEVRMSGLLKDRIVITYPETKGNDMAVLQAASDEWKNKWDHWYQFCQEQHYAHVYPIFLIQVANAKGNRISETDMDECLRIIEERTGERFLEGQVVHAFGEGTSTLQINGLNVPYEEPSRISDNRKIKLVFFKETLTTGWDCPRAETMMSFRKAVDFTHIAQLLGRMIRTPLQQKVLVDETLNEVHLFLPNFDEATVYEVVDALKSTEGATIPTDVEVEEVEAGSYETLSLKPTYEEPPRKPISQGGKAPTPKNGVAGQISMDFDGNTPVEEPAPTPVSTATTDVAPPAQQQEQPVTATPAPVAQPPVSGGKEELPVQTDTQDTAPVSPVVEDTPAPEIPYIDREAVVKAVNESGLLTYHVRRVAISDYVKSMYALAHLLTQTRIDMDCMDVIRQDIVKMIHDYALYLKQVGKYDFLTEQVMQFKLNTQIYDVFGKSVDHNEVHDLFSTTDIDIERQFRHAETRLGDEGIGKVYCNTYYNENTAIANEIEVILFAADVECMQQLHDYAKEKFHQLNDDNRRKTVYLPEKFKKKYDDIVSDGDPVSKHNFRLPELIRVPKEYDGEVYWDHLFVDNSGTAVINLNGWERKVIREERGRDDFICWLRNPSRGSWALCIPYELDGEIRHTYPDFLVVRESDGHMVVDILEPHDPTRIDNLGKAKGFAEYARDNPGVGRIQLIKMKKDALGQERAFRLDMSKSSIRDKVRHCASMDELTHVFDEYGYFES
jgi:type III restriction enzyme